LGTTGLENRMISIGSVFFLVLIVVTVISTAKIVPQGNNFTVERLGRYVRTLGPGLGIIVPFIGIKLIDVIITTLKLI